MAEKQLHVVTGALGYSGRHIAQRVLAEGHKLATLTNSTHRSNPFGDQLEVHRFNFDNPSKLTESLKGASVLYNTYWVRFNYKTFTYDAAIKNSITLFDCARRAGVERIVHISITNPSEDSHLQYFRGKAIVEKALQQSGISHCILRPAVLFGNQGILINNIAWMLRKLPVFGVFGHGNYRLEPIFVDDLASLAVEHGHQETNTIINAIGPEMFTYRDLIKQIAGAIGVRRPIVSVRPRIGYIAASIIGKIIGDVVITRDEIQGLMADLLYVGCPPTGTTRLTQWLKENADSLGRHYANELARRTIAPGAQK